MHEIEDSINKSRASIWWFKAFDYLYFKVFAWFAVFDPVLDIIEIADVNPEYGGKIFVLYHVMTVEESWLSN